MLLYPTFLVLKQDKLLEQCSVPTEISSDPETWLTIPVCQTCFEYNQTTFIRPLTKCSCRYFTFEMIETMIVPLYLYSHCVVSKELRGHFFEVLFNWKASALQFLFSIRELGLLTKNKLLTLTKQCRWSATCLFLLILPNSRSINTRVIGTRG